mmetsp:Transcript_61717/g.198888  ORF Transcript_61717/g.198888 Transcript_61717/m.198888 type:complete len:655 (+) Transcript_61717:114-2078(+)
MACVIDVHDRMVAQLYQRNAQLAQEKSEAELRLRQATALLAELQSVWMDLPPRIADSIHKVLASQTKEGPKGRGKGQPLEGGRRSSWTWLSFGMDDMFGCTAARDSEPADPMPKRLPPPVAAPCGVPERRRIGSAEVAGGLPRQGQAGLSKPCGADAMAVQLDAAVGQTEVSPAVEVGDLLCEAPGAATLVAEIDVLCHAMRKDTERSFEELQHCMESLKAETKLHRQRLEDAFRHAMKAQHAELEVCKAQLAQLSENMVQRFSLAQDPQPEFCDAEWAWSRRMADLRAQAGQLHVDWLEDCLGQRVQAAEALVAAREQAFKQDLAALWERKFLLTSRLRGRVAIGAGDGAAGGQAGVSEELAQVRRALGELEAGAVVPLRELAAGRGQAEQAQMKRLKAATSEAQAQGKAAATHLGSLAEKNKAELKARLGGANAALLAHRLLERRHLVIRAFLAWSTQRLKVQLEAAREELASKSLEAAGLDARLRASSAACARADRRRQRAEASRSVAVHSVCGRLEQRATLFVIFKSWEDRLTEPRVQLGNTENLAAQRFSAEAAVRFTAEHRASSYRLALALHGWVVQTLRKVVRRSSEQAVAQETQAETRVAVLRSELLRLLDERVPEANPEGRPAGALAQRTRHSGAGQPASPSDTE